VHPAKTDRGARRGAPAVDGLGPDEPALIHRIPARARAKGSMRPPKQAWGYLRVALARAAEHALHSVRVKPAGQLEAQAGRPDHEPHDVAVLAHDEAPRRA
jgi:hypothetical protein